MSSGFGNEKLNVVVYKDEVDKLLKSYKKVKKYMRSAIYDVKKLDGTERVVSDLLKDYYDPDV
jgi:hypothetical protein